MKNPVSHARNTQQPGRCLWVLLALAYQLPVFANQEGDRASSGQSDQGSDFDSEQQTTVSVDVGEFRFIGKGLRSVEVSAGKLRFKGKHVYPQSIEIETLKFRGKTVSPTEVNVEVLSFAGRFVSPLIGLWHCPMGAGLKWRMRFLDNDSFDWRQDLTKEYFMDWRGSYSLKKTETSVLNMTITVQEEESNLSDVGRMQSKIGYTTTSSIEFSGEDQFHVDKGAFTCTRQE